jgi:AraC-like DNA-binding protein
MLLISPDSLQIAMSETLPAVLDGFKIPNSKPLYGSTLKGRYLFQDLYCKKFHACFINLLAATNHKIILLKKAPEFFIMVQLKNTLECEFFNLTNGQHHEWSINFFHATNIFAEISLHKDKSYTTFILFIPPEVVRRLCKEYTTIEHFYELQNDSSITSRLHKGNPICNFQVMDLIQAIQFDRHFISIKTYVELITASFELLNKKSTPKQKHVEDKALQKIYDLKTYMLENIASNLTRNDLCKKYKLSLYYFENGFKNIYDAPPFLLLRFYRMSIVKQEIEKHNTGLKELAAKFHYSYNAFIRAYQSIYKAHPTTHKSKPQQVASKKLWRKNKTNYPKVRKK